MTPPTSRRDQKMESHARKDLVSEAARGRRYARWIDILVLCTANRCRSPIAEGLLAARIARRGLPATVASAGLLPGGHPPPSEVVALLAEWGINISGHLSTQVAEADLERAHLILGMERAHVREVAVLCPPAWPRTFTLKELVRRGEQSEARAQEEDLDAWVAKIHQGRTRAELLGDSPLDDVADPYGGRASDYEAAFAEISDLVNRLIDLLFPMVPASSTG